MAPPGPIPVTVLTGFLGSGKTTLLNRLLGNPALRDTAVVVNEIGEIGLDHLLIASASDSIVLLEGGCLCCAVIDSLAETLADLYRSRATGKVPHFSRVVVETTGLANPAPILRALMRDKLINDLFAVHGLVCTVDAMFGAGQIEAHPEALAQVAMADRIVITKTDLVPPETIDDLEHLLRRVSPVALLYRPSPEDSLIGLVFGPASTAGYADPAPAPHGVGTTTTTLRLPHPCTWAGIAAWTATLKLLLGDDLLRCKGWLEVTGEAGPVVLHGVQTIFDTRRQPRWPDNGPPPCIVCITRHGRPAWLESSLPLLSAPAGTMPPQNTADLGFLVAQS